MRLGSVSVMRDELPRNVGGVVGGVVGSAHPGGRPVKSPSVPTT